jgi:ATP-dependent DNA helicase RecG
VYALQTLVDEKRILFFQVDKGADEVFQLPDGRVVVRLDKRTMPASVRNLQFGQREAASRRFDRQWVDGATVQDLDIELVESTASRYLSRLSLTVEKFLQQVDLAQYTAGGLRLRMAALLLFAKDIRKWHARCQVRFVKIAGTELRTGAEYNAISDETVEGNILELIPAAWEAFQKYIVQSNALTPAGKFEPQYLFPAEACLEALVNAIFHRDYSITAPIEINMFDDRVEIKSPGALLSTLSVEDLYASESRHDSRNVGIARVLKTVQAVREMGEGMKRILHQMEAGGYPRPHLYSNTNWFTIGLIKKPT